LIAEDDDYFGEVKMVKVLAGRRKVRDEFDVKRVKSEGGR
jgi:hypothetical protein